MQTWLNLRIIYFLLDIPVCRAILLFIRFMPLFIKCQRKIKFKCKLSKDKTHLSHSFELIARSKKSSLTVINLLLRNLYGNEHENWRQTTESIFVVESFLGSAEMQSSCGCARQTAWKCEKWVSDVHEENILNVDVFALWWECHKNVQITFLLLT